MKEEGETEWDICRRKGNKQGKAAIRVSVLKESEESLGGPE